MYILKIQHLKSIPHCKKFTSEEQFPKSAPVGLPTSPNDGQQNFNFNLSAVIDSNNYSTYMNTISTGTYNTANTYCWIFTNN